jgi:phosphatidylglycerophosphate synthase
MVRSGITPNQISLSSIFFGLLAGVALLLSGRSTSIVVDWCWFGLVIVGIQLRLVCNLIDGMVAVEGGQKTPTGDLYNEFPDRLADSFVLIGAGYAADPVYGPALGWCAALVAMLTAYTRVLGRSVGAGVYFIGPMAKQHRMALLTLTCVVAACLHFVRLDRTSFSFALTVVVLGSIVTTWRRLAFIARDLRNKAP